MARVIALGALRLAAASGALDAGACAGTEDASLLQTGGRRDGQGRAARDEAGAEFGPLSPGGWGWWMPQNVSALFYRPHFKCAKSEEGVSNARKWLESVMDGTTNGQGDELPKPDFVGYSEMQSEKGLPGESRAGYGDYGVISSVCGKYRDPVALYYRSKQWTLLESYPPNLEKCGQYSPWSGNTSGPFNCPEGRTAPSEDDCCACTYSQAFADAPFYSDVKVQWSDNSTSSDMGQVMGDRPFVIGRFEDQRSGRKVCAVTFNLPHQFLADCTNELDAACFTNAAGNAYRLGTEQLVMAINQVCAQTPLLFFGDTNSGSGAYETGFMFNNPHTQDVAPDAGPCRQPAPLLSLRDPPSALHIEGQPYTCCFDEPSLKYASDRVAASGPSWSSLQGFFTPKKIAGGAREAGGLISDPDSVGIASTCPDAAPAVRGYPCCGIQAEHAPVWGYFQLFR